MSKPVEYFRTKAQEMRDLADQTWDKKMQAQLLQLAVEYDELAKRTESESASRLRNGQEV